MATIDLIRILIVLAITFIYALYDVFNNREVPDGFVYASLIVGLILLLTYNFQQIVIGLFVAAVVFVFGYVLYRGGWLGAGDFLEFVFVSIAIPTTITPILDSVPQFSTPFIFSVFIGAGYSVSIFLPIYYLFFTRESEDERRHLRGQRPRYMLGLAVLLFYALLILLLSQFVKYTLTGIIVIEFLAIPSSLILIYEKNIYFRMVSFVYPKELQHEDMIAMNLMSQDEIAYYKGRTKSFGRLITPNILHKIKNGKVKIPVYRNSVPFALFIFLGVVLSLLIGNVVFLILF